MTTTETIQDHKLGNQPFWIHLSDGRRFKIPQGDYISVHPSGRGTGVTVYGPGEDEEHYVPIFAITSVSKGEKDDTPQNGSAAG
jgi:hypothetical protein